MRLMGADVRPVVAGTGTKDATSGSDSGLGDECRNSPTSWVQWLDLTPTDDSPRLPCGDWARNSRQCQEKWGGLPDILLACVGGSNAMGLFHEFVDEPVRLIGVEAAGEGVETEKHAATLTQGELVCCMER